MKNYANLDSKIGVEYIMLAIINKSKAKNKAFNSYDMITLHCV